MGSSLGSVMAALKPRGYRKQIARLLAHNDELRRDLRIEGQMVDELIRQNDFKAKKIRGLEEIIARHNGTSVIVADATQEEWSARAAELAKFARSDFEERMHAAQMESMSRRSE